MPNFTATQARVRIASGNTIFSPPRFNASPAAVRITGGATSFTILGEVTRPRVERLRRFEERSGGSGLQATTLREQIIQQLNAEGIEKAFDQIIANQLALEQAFNLAREGLTKATNVENRASVSGSFTNPTSILTAANDGTITIAAHTRVYADGTTVSVNGGSVTGLTNGQDYTVFYRDAARAGGAVSYETTTNVVAQGGNIHVAGRVTIPAIGQPPADGLSPLAPGVPQFDLSNLRLYEFL